MITKVIHRVSKSDKLPWEERRLIKEAERILPNWSQKLWPESGRKAIELYTPEYLGMYDELPFGVMKADIARYALMHGEGGVYCDTDYRWIKEIPSEILGASCFLPISRGSSDDMQTMRLGNAVFGSSPGHPFWTDFIGHMLCRKEEILSATLATIEKLTGPEALTHFYIANADKYHDVFLPERSLFHPPSPRRNPFGRGGPRSVGLHYAWGSWRQKNLLKAAKTLAFRKISAI